MEIRKMKFQNKCRLKTGDHKTKSNQGLILFWEPRVSKIEKGIITGFIHLGLNIASAG